MFGSARSGANAYAQVGVETGIVAASPHKLIIMLFEGAMTSITAATQHMRANDIPAKGKAISKAIDIIENGLRASLDRKVGGAIALNLDALYEYMNKQLLMANLKNDAALLDEVHGLLKGLKESWEAISPEQQAGAAAEPPVRRVANDPFAPAPSSTLAKA